MTSQLDSIMSLLDNSLTRPDCSDEASTDEGTKTMADTLTVNETAAILNCSISFVYKLMDQAQISFERRGRRKLPVRASVDEYRQRSLVPTQKPPEPAKAKGRKEPYKYEFL
jgi:excisionase family DNA binding protein